MVTINKMINGFTLIELMIALAVVGILATIAYPSYKQYQIRSKRIEAQSEIMQISQGMANYKLKNGTFTNATINDIYGGTVTPRQNGGLYNLVFNPITANNWTLVATPQPSKSQMGDGVITLTDAGVQCWYKGKDSGYSTTDCKSWSEK